MALDKPEALACPNSTSKGKGFLSTSPSLIDTPAVPIKAQLLDTQPRLQIRDHLISNQISERTDVHKG